MTASAHTTPARLKRILIWGSLVLAVLIAFALVIIIAAPRVMNTDAVRSKIEATIARDLNGTLTYERMDLALVPRPEIRFRNLAIDIPGAASAALASVDIQAKLIPLLLGRFEIASVTLDQPDLKIAVPGTSPERPARSAAQKAPASRSADSVLAVAGRSMPDLDLRITHGRLSLIEDGATVLVVGDLTADLAFVTEVADAREQASDASKDHYHITGSARTVLSGSSALPGPLKIAIDHFDAVPGRLSVSRSRAHFLDMDVKVSGSVQNALAGTPRYDIVFSGEVGRDSAAWLRGLVDVPRVAMLRTPLTVKESRLRTSGTGSNLKISLKSSISQKDGAELSLTVHHRAGLFSLDNLQIKDKESNAVLSLTSSPGEIELVFKGNLAGSTLTGMTELATAPFRIIDGDLRVRLDRGQWTRSTAEGTLRAEGLIVPVPVLRSFTIERVSLQAQGQTAELRPSVLTLGRDTLTAGGTASLSEDTLSFDLDISADRIGIESLRLLTKGTSTESGTETAPSVKRKTRVEGELRIRAAAVTFPSYTADAVAVNVVLEEDRTTAELEHASICGIDLQGSLLLAYHEVNILLEPHVRGGRLETTVPCIMRGDRDISGAYDLSGRFTSHGTWTTLLPSLQGNLDVTAKGGRVQNDRIVKGIIAYLDSTSLLKGSNEKLLQQGVPFDTFLFRGSLREGVITMQQGSIKGKDLHLAAEGAIDLRRSTLDLKVLAAPFTTMDRLLGSIPIVKQIAGSALIVVPVKVEGPFQALKVKPLAAESVGTNVSNLMKNIVQMPVKIVDPMLPREREKGRP